MRKQVFVVYWEDPGTGKVYFAWAADWKDVADVFKFHIRDNASGTTREDLLRQVSNVFRSQGGIERDKITFQPGAFNATQFAPDRAPTTFVLARRPGTALRLPLLGPSEVIDAELKLLARSAPNMHLDRGKLAADPYRLPSDIPRRANRTAAAATALEALRGATAIREAIAGLKADELTWLAYEAAELQMPEAFRIAAETALSRERSISTLNLCGSAYRRYQPTRSKERFEESLDLVASPAYNPYGWIGLAATLRRLHELDAAYDCVKRALKFYPQNEYALGVKRALLREMPGYRAFRNARPEDESLSLIEELPLMEGLLAPDDPELWSPLS